MDSNLLGGSRNLKVEEERDLYHQGFDAIDIENRKFKNLLHNCLLAFNEMPNKALNGIGGYPDTYALAKEINRVIKP